MATTQSRLSQLSGNLDESIGVRRQNGGHPKLSPVASLKDAGRRPLRGAASIRIDQIIPDPSQPREEFLPESIERLAGSMQEKGQLAPIRVRWSGGDNKWIIICGERRWRAAQRARLETVECLCHEENLSGAEVLELQMIENLLREELSPIEQARGFSSLMELRGWNGKQLAEQMHVPASTVSRALALLDLPPEIQRRVDSGEVAARSAYEISKVKDNAVKHDLAEKVAAGMTLKQTQEAVRKRKRKPRPPIRNKRLEFQTESGWKIIAVPPSDSTRRTYDSLMEAIDHMTEDVQARIQSNIRID